MTARIILVIMLLFAWLTSGAQAAEIYISPNASLDTDSVYYYAPLFVWPGGDTNTVCAALIVRQPISPDLDDEYTIALSIYRVLLDTLNDRIAIVARTDYNQYGDAIAALAATTQYTVTTQIAPDKTVSITHTYADGQTGYAWRHIRPGTLMADWRDAVLDYAATHNDVIIQRSIARNNSITWREE